MVDLGLDRLSQKWIAERTIILGPSGSYAYGTFNENSDHDYKGVVIPPKEYYFGLEAFNEYNNTGGKNYKKTKTIKEATAKMMNSAMPMNPNPQGMDQDNEMDQMMDTDTDND